MLAIIGGSGVYNPSMLEKVKEIKVETPYGMITRWLGSIKAETWFSYPGTGLNIPYRRIALIIRPIFGDCAQWGWRGLFHHCGGQSKSADETGRFCDHRSVSGFY